MSEYARGFPRGTLIERELVTPAQALAVAKTLRSFDCRVCGLSLANTAQIVAARIPRLREEEFSESRYEGWEELMTYEDAVTFLGEADYGND